ncbi:MAG TPA: hypothetical protein VKU77_00665 [Streptosporangiaceae bacterium]|nr:hypothetical protein [Streptosporangiaceae bacterium]
MHSPRSKVLSRVFTGAALLLGIGAMTGGPAHAAAPTSASANSSYTPAKAGELDCNGFSTAQKELRASLCTDISGNIKGAYDGKYYDNRHYIGHDEPDTTFLSNAPGSGGNVTWTETLGRDPSGTPGNSHPGSDLSKWFELSPAPWFSMALCDPNSFPGTPCTPNSDSNAPTCVGVNCGPTTQGGGSAFMEMQLYPPGNAPFVDSESCDATHWCAALNIDSFTGTPTANANPACVEPVNFAFIQTNGVPAGPPSPQFANLTTFVPNGNTLLMNPGDTISVHMSDAPASGGGHAFEVVINDLTTHQTGFMQASAANGFMTTSASNCAGNPFNFEPEYSTAGKNNIIPWAALVTNISTEFETGHFEACTSLSAPITNPLDANDTGGSFNQCNGPYENAGPPDSTTTETGDAMCYPQGDTHPNYAGEGTSTAPVQVSHCQDNIFQNGDVNFDGTPYWKEWPTGLRPNLNPSSFLERFPTTNGRQYSQFFFQTDVALSEATCTPDTLSGCTVPPQGPGGFYPYWTALQAPGLGVCALEFGNVSGFGALNTFGKDAQYGTNQFPTLGYPEFEGPVHNNTCARF